MDIYLVRHTRLQGVEGICYGRTDVTPGPGFIIEAEALKSKLSSITHPTVFSSPAYRCRALAEILTRDDFSIAPEIQELDFGMWEGRPWNSIPREEMDTWSNDYLNVACPKGESLSDMINRVLPFWKNLIQQAFGNAILVTHAGPIRVILTHLLDISAREMFSVSVGFGSISKIRCIDGKAEVVFVNE